MGLPLTACSLSENGIYLLDDGLVLTFWIGRCVDAGLENAVIQDHKCKHNRFDVVVLHQNDLTVFFMIRPAKRDMWATPSSFHKC